MDYIRINSIHSVLNTVLRHGVNNKVQVNNILGEIHTYVNKRKKYTHVYI